MKELSDLYGIDINTLLVMRAGSFQPPYFVNKLTCDIPGRPGMMVEIIFRKGLLTWFEKSISRSSNVVLK